MIRNDYGEIEEWIQHYYGGDNETSDMTTAYYYDGLDRLAKQVGADEIEGVLEYDRFGPIRTLRNFKELE